MLEAAAKEALALVEESTRDARQSEETARSEAASILADARERARELSQTLADRRAEADEAARLAEEAQERATVRLAEAEAKEASLRAVGRAKALEDEGRRAIEADAQAQRTELLAAAEAEAQRRLDEAKAEQRRLLHEAEQSSALARKKSRSEVEAAVAEARVFREKLELEAIEAAQELARARERDAAARSELRETLEAAAADRQTDADRVLLAREEELAASASDLDAQARNLSGREGLLSRRLADVEMREGEILEDRQQIEAMREALQAQERRTGVGRAADLEARLEEETARSESLVARIRLVSLERDEARRAADVSQPGSLRLQEQLTDAENEITRLRTKVGESARPQELERLRDAAADSDQLRAENADLRQRNRDLAVAQRGFDEERARQLAERDRLQQTIVEGEQGSADQRMALEERLAEVKSEIDELLRLRDQWEDAARERTRLTERLDHLQTENSLLQKELTDIHKKSSERTEGTFGRLAQIEDGQPSIRNAPTAGTLLKSVESRLLARGFRFDRRDIGVFLAGLATTRLQILQGVSGTGKTSLVREMASALGAEFVSIPVQAGWRERADLFGSWNAFARQFESSPFTEALYRARTAAQADVPVFLLLDEINLSRVEYYLADLLSVLEQPEDRHVIELFGAPLPAGLAAPALLEPDRRSLRIAPNIWLFGTANEDESTMEITDKVYDRSVVLHLDQRAPHCDRPQHHLEPLNLGAASLRQIGATSPKVLATLDRALDGFLGGIAPRLRDTLEAGVGNRLSGQLRSFIPAMSALGFAQGDALDHVVATRLLRRVARVRDPYMSKSLNTLAQQIEAAWPAGKGWGKPARSAQLLHARAQLLAQR